MNSIIIPEQPSLGAGYYSIGEEVMGDCIDLTPGQVEDEGGASDDLQLTTFNSSASIRKEFAASGAASFGFGIFKASMTASYIDNSNISRYSTYMHVLSNSVQTKKRISTSNIKLTKQAKNYAKNMTRFIQHCGDKFFSSIQTGGSFEAVVQFDSETDEQQHQLETSLSASGFLNGDANLKQRLADLVKTTNTKYSVKITRSGVNGAYPKGEISELIDYAFSFPSTVKADVNANTIISFGSLKYSTVLPFDDTEAEKSTSVLDRLASLYEEASKIKAGITYVKAHPSDFSPRAQIDGSDAVIVEDVIAQIRMRADLCKQDFEKCNTEGILVPNLRLPERMVWKGIDETNPSFQPIGIVPNNQQRVLEVKGIWNCNGTNPACWLSADSSIQYEVIGSDGAIAQSGETSNGTALIKAAGVVKVRVGDGPAAMFADNTHMAANPLGAVLW